MSLRTLPPPAFRTPLRRSRCLFQWEAADLSLAARTGQVGTFVRAGDARALDTSGRVRRAVHSQLRYEAVDLDGDGVREALGVLLERAATNVALQSQDLTSGSWYPGGAATVTAGAAAPDGTATATLVTLPNIGSGIERHGVGAAGTQYTMSAWLSGTGTLVLGVYDNVTGPVSSPRIALTSTPTRYSFTFTFGAGSTDRRIVPVTRRNDPLNTATSVTVWGVQVEAGPGASGYIPTLGAVASRVAEQLSFPFAAPPQAMTWYARFIERGTSRIAQARLLQLGHTNGAYPSLDIHGTGAGYESLLNVGDVTYSTINTLPTVGELVELRLTVSAAGATQLHMSRSGGAETSGVVGTAPIPAGWSAATLSIGGTAEMNVGLNLYQCVRIAPGVLTMDQMRGLGG